MASEASFPGEPLLSQFLTDGGPLAFVLLVLLGVSLGFSGFLFWRDIQREKDFADRIAKMVEEETDEIRQKVDHERKNVLQKVAAVMDRILNELERHRHDFQRTYDLNKSQGDRFNEEGKANVIVLTKILTFLTILEREGIGQNGHSVRKETAPK